MSWQISSSDKRGREQSGARGARAGGLGFRLKIYFQRHVYALIASLGQLWRSPLATLMTTLTIAVTLALPAGLILIVNSAEQFTSDWQGMPQISLYVQPGASKEAIDSLSQQLEVHSAVAVQEQISPTQGMQTVTELMGIQGLVGMLGGNPLPHVIVLDVNESHRSTEQLTAIIQELSSLPGVDLVQVDMEWLKKLNAMLTAFERGVWLVSGLLAVAVMLTIGNTVRLSIQNKLEEIEVMKLIGAKDAFIRRPFLYGGFWLGLVSGCFAVILLMVSYALLREPFEHVLTLYGSVFQISMDLILRCVAGLMLCAVVLGWLGAWISVARQLNRIEPT